MRIGLVGAGRIGTFHASTLAQLDQVETLVVTDAFPEAAARLATERGWETAESVEDLLGRVDGVVITSATASHGEILRQSALAGVPTFCEKPLALSLAETIDVVRVVEESGTPVQVGFQRRFDEGYRAAKQAIDSGELGFLHTVRLNTNDQSPPPAAYIPTSGGLIRDCNVHDFDILRFLTGREVVNAYALGANKGEDFFAEGGDVDTAAALLTLDDDTLAIVSATRYNGAGHDVRAEVMGSEGTVGVGYDESLAVRSAEPGAVSPTAQKWSYMERFQPAYRSELTAFTEVVAGSRPSPCTVRDALAAFRIAEACEQSRIKGQPVALSDIGTIAP
ncbi:Gfo/Idh/MocA family protein [Millisia brevis]|uniref:Gfo/Idh/MocA family protein n=1 Tax=Millisia brevis TaxID=264148 RepID=UPI00082A51C7|nr:Gfo/Idh/MocA family oxidoreductase [Millisia brevis]